MSLIRLIFRFPMRIICKHKGHELVNDNGFMGMFAPKYKWWCKRCGIRSEGSIDDMEKKGFISNLH